MFEHPQLPSQYSKHQPHVCSHKPLSSLLSPHLVPVSSEQQDRLGAGVCPGTAPGALFALSLANLQWLSLGGSLEGHLQGP
eukprot:5087122-Pleurochrysis_carterae.AAC.1